MLVISKQSEGTSKRFMVGMSLELEHLRVSSTATVAKEKKWMEEANNGTSGLR